jgi:hypothetical protein
MAILPMDLQALFATSISAGQEQAATRNAPGSAQAAQAADLVQQTHELDEGVSDTSDVGDGPERTDEDGDGTDSRRRRVRRSRVEAAAEETQPREVLNDPDLGQHVDVVG